MIRMNSTIRGRKISRTRSTVTPGFSRPNTRSGFLERRQLEIARQHADHLRGRAVHVQNPPRNPRVAGKS
jgi:hypothetical protein